MQSTAFEFGTDLLDEGYDTVLGHLQERGPQFPAGDGRLWPALGRS